MNAATQLTDGAAPPGLDPATHHVRSASFVGLSKMDFAELQKLLVAKAGTRHNSI
jgi:hypothetical protein